MKQVRPTIILMVLFFSGLLGLWWLDSAGVPTEADRRARQQRILPKLADAGELTIRRIEIDREGQKLSLERRGNVHWQMTGPLDVAAEPAAVESLIRSLKDLRRSPDAGAVPGPAESYGLAPPSAVVRVFGEPGNGDGPLAALELGRTVRGVTYVRPVGGGEIDVIDGKLAASLDRPVGSWREVNLVPTPTFQASSLRVTRGDATIRAERSAAGRWTLTTPIRLPANGPKIESLLAALSAVRALGDKGFVADGVKDFSPYGLDHPQAIVEIGAPEQAGGPIVLEVGKRVPGAEGRVYVRRGDQDDVVEVSDRFLGEIPTDDTALRSQAVADFNPASIRKIQIDGLGTTFRLERKGDGWQALSPEAEKADNFAVQSMLNQLASLQSSEFLPPDKGLRADLVPPTMSIRLWGPEKSSKGSDQPIDAAPALSLQVGRHDVLRKAIYGRLEGDRVILVLPDALLDRLPRSRFAFRDRSLVAISPASVSRLTVSRPGLTAVVEPDRSATEPNQWRMLAPVKARADVRGVTKILGLLSDLHAEDFVGDIQAAASYGLDPPAMSLTWEVDPAPPAPAGKAAAGGPTGSSIGRSGRLNIGKEAAGKAGARYASLEGQPFVFVLPAAAIETLGVELHETAIFSTSAASVRRLVFRSRGRTLAFTRRATPKGDATDWSPEPGTDMRGIDLSRFNDLVAQVSRLQAQHFLQYGGPIPESTGLARPRLEIELAGDPDRPPEILRLGGTDGTLVAAAAGRSASGAVFTLPAAAWDALIGSLTSGEELPRQPFAP
ncbi:DUF4340 domain-containing protein [Aquisphaera insulae]|uniref:DUF4340 domain-containing protein n=1 Tax=Aquisphaera insulae TaxID=2712864 RepID=UPI0013EC79ED|nr:DUF4340 domain-containing protein [Aquisphaera insulae]